MVFLDANIILRYVLCDDENQAQTARKLIYGGNCFATNEVLAEVVYVLNKVYKIDAFGMHEKTRRSKFFRDKKRNQFVFLKKNLILSIAFWHRKR